VTGKEYVGIKTTVENGVELQRKKKKTGRRQKKKNCLAVNTKNKTCKKELKKLMVSGQRTKRPGPTPHFCCPQY